MKSRFRNRRVEAWAVTLSHLLVPHRFHGVLYCARSFDLSLARLLGMQWQSSILNSFYPIIANHVINKERGNDRESDENPTLGRMAMKYEIEMVEYWAIHSSVRSHRSLIRLLRTARFARALRSFVRSLAHSLTHSLRSSWERGFCL